MQYTSSRPLQEALRFRLRELAATHVRYGYRRLTVLLRWEGWMVNAKRTYRLYEQENLKVRSAERKKISRQQRVPQGPATGPNQYWSADFVSDKSLFQLKDELKGAKRVLSFRVLNSTQLSSWFRCGENVGIAPHVIHFPLLCWSDFQGLWEGRKTTHHRFPGFP
jgi:hypothetical protein